MRANDTVTWKEECDIRRFINVGKSNPLAGGNSRLRLSHLKGALPRGESQ
jgi:hypothetical protein